MAESTKEQRQFAIEAYKVLVSVMTHEETLVWRRNEFLFAANGGLMTILGLVLTTLDRPTSSWVGVFLSLGGVALCILWAYVAFRGRAFHDHWYDQLIALEKEYLAPVEVFGKAETCFKDGHVLMAGEERRLDWKARPLKIHSVIILLPILFLIGWLVFLKVSLISLIVYFVVGW